MGIKVSEQVYPGQNSAFIKPKKPVDPIEWERKQRLKEYRIAARREKRNRKSDEKKQRKLNATILRRMTRNPQKYNKNAARNKLHAIEAERRKIQSSAIFMAQRLAAVYDPSGITFNVKPVTTLEDGRVVTLESLERKREREEQKNAERDDIENGESEGRSANGIRSSGQSAVDAAGPTVDDLLNPERMARLIDSKMPQKRPNGISKTQQRKLEKFAPRPPPPKPTIPEGIELPSDEEENWLELWDLPDHELERRLIRAKKRAARARKELRIRQKAGKAERRAARDEKRRVYRDIKLSWKVIREEERRRRKFLLAMEDEERKRLAVEVANHDRKLALECCERLGFTLGNVEGVEEIKPRALGLKGANINFDELEVVGETGSGLRNVVPKKEEVQSRSNRANLRAIADESTTKSIYANEGVSGDILNLDQGFVEFGDVDGQDHEAINFNHKVRRKLRRAIESAQIKKELLVREAAIKHCEEKGIPVPDILRTDAKPNNTKGQRVMPNGTLETAKQERVRARVELTEFNNHVKVLRKQAKEMAIEAGIRIYLELMGRIPKREGLDEEMAERAAAKAKASGQPNTADDSLTGTGLYSGESMADLIASWPMPEYDGAGEEMDVYGERPVYEFLEESSEDSAAKQLKTEMADIRTNGVENRKNHSEVDDAKGENGSEDESETSDVEMSDASL